MPDRQCPTAFTVVARNYLPAATVLAKSYLSHHPDHHFRIAVVDVTAGELAELTVRDGVEVVGPDTFGIDQDEFLRMATAYNVTELATAVKPFIFQALRAESDVVIYLDPDIVVFSPMPELVELAMKHQIVLTPHCCQPMPRDGKAPNEAAIMASGVFNLGFIATGPGSEQFLSFWAERLRHDAIVAPDRQLFTDQRWVDLVPAHFTYHALRDSGFNVAYWNAHERPLRRDPDGVLTAGGRLLRFFHFSGYRPEKAWILSHHAPDKPRILLSEHPEIRELCDDYAKALRAAGYAESLEATPYGFAKLSDGTALTMAMRRMFREAWIAAERKKEPLPPHAFGSDGGAQLRAWLSEPPEDAPLTSALSRHTAAIWGERADLRRAFPEPHGRDAVAFREWLRTSGRTEEKLADWAVPVEPAPFSEPVAEFGVNVLGYLTAELGVGEQGRNVHDAIVEAGIPVVSVIEDRLVSNRTNVDPSDTVGEPRFPITVLCVNADQTAVILDRHAEAGHHRYRIGVWAWELEEFPGWLHPAFDLLDEVWTVSEFCRAAIAPHSPIPVKAIPIPVRDPHWSMPRRTAGDQVQFLFAFDFNSVAERKNPWGLVEAFRRAFGDRDDVRLVIKSINGDKHPHSAERLRVAADQDWRIELIEDYLTAVELDELYASSHCYVSLHRSEGFGLTVAEAMARGMPVIATGYSSTTEFLDEHTGWPIPYRMVDVGHGNGPYPPDARWADPDLDAAAGAMRQVADDPQEAARRARLGRDRILTTRSMKSTADWMARELEAAYQAKGVRRAERQVDGPLTPLQKSREALRWRPEVSSSSRIPLAPALRKAVLRVIDHYDVHQRSVLGALTDGVEGSLTELLGRIEQAERRLSALDLTEKATARSVDELREQTAAAHRAQDEKQNRHEEKQDRQETDVSALRGDLRELRDSAGSRFDEVAVRIGEYDKKTFDMFVERDGRWDSAQASLRDVATLRQALSMLHAPVPTGTEVVLCDAGVLLVPVDEVFLPWLSHHRTWENAEAELMAELATGGLFVDVGAHVGYHTLRLLRSSAGITGAVAVEANAATADLLARNITVNLPAAMAEKVTVLPLAAWDSEITLRLNQHELGNSGDYRVSAAGDLGAAVRAIPLDGVQQISEQKVGLVKIDLQGRDHRAIAGLAAVVDRDHPHVICEFAPEAIEDLGDDPREVLAGYRKLGYRLVPVRDTGADHTRYPDQVLVDQARAAETGFLTMWLKPS